MIRCRITVIYGILIIVVCEGHATAGLIINKEFLRSTKSTLSQRVYNAAVRFVAQARINPTDFAFGITKGKKIVRLLHTNTRRQFDPQINKERD